MKAYLAPETKTLSMLSYNLDEAIKYLNTQLLGMNTVIELSVAAAIARSHVLLEGVPGLGKTSLARALAQVFGGKFSRIQMTSDMLPADVVGILRPRFKDEGFEFRPGPVFANFVLADELNRCNPRTQSALLECMSEGTVSIDGTSYALPSPFFLMATQNPEESFGVYPLTESQLDRFSLNLYIDFPSASEERKLYMDRIRSIAAPVPVKILGESFLHKAYAESDLVHVDESLIDFIQMLLSSTRDHKDIKQGMSVRSGVQWLALAKSLAWVRKRNHVLPKDFIDLAPSLMAHRLVFRQENLNLPSKRKFVEDFVRSLKAPF